MLRKIIVAAAFAALFAGGAARAETVSVTTGAGYVPMSKALVAAWKQKSGASVSESYGGNIGQMLAQIASGSDVNVVITDKGTLERLKTPVKFSTEQNLGRTPLVLVWRKGLSLKSPDDLQGSAVKTIALPDPKAAVYGRAGAAYLKSRGWDQSLKAKTMQVANVPQVFSYVSRGEVDTGFVNRQVVSHGAGKIGGSLEIKDGYPPIDMVALVVSGHEKDANVKAFLGFLKTPEAKRILKNFGID